MSEPTLTREAWRYLIKSAYGLKGVADTLDDLVGQARMDGEEREHMHNLTAAVLALAESMRETIVAMDDANIWEAPMFVREEQSNV